MLALAATYISSAAYVAGGPDVVTQLRGRLPASWRCTLAAVDGAMVGDVPRQLDRVARDATHLVISVGGNDALRQEAVLRESARSVGEVLARLAQVRDRFQQDYRAMLNAILPGRCLRRSAPSTTRASRTRRDSAWPSRGWPCSTT